MRGAGAAQRRQHVELARLQTEAREQRVEVIPRNQLRRLVETTHQRHRQCIEIGAFAVPLGQDGVYGVGLAWVGHGM